MGTTYEQMRAAQERLQNAQLAEQQRREAASAPEREIAAAQAALAKASYKARQEAFEAQAAHVAATAQAVNDANAAVIEALGQGDVRGALPLYRQAMQTWNRHREAILAALGTVNEDIQNAASARSGTGGADAPQAQVDFQRQWGAQGQASQYIDRLTQAYKAEYALVQYIAQASGEEKLIRQGQCFPLLGRLADAGYGFNPMREYLNKYNQQLLGRR